MKVQLCSLLVLRGGSCCGGGRAAAVQHGPLNTSIYILVFTYTTRPSGGSTTAGKRPDRYYHGPVIYIWTCPPAPKALPRHTFTAAYGFTAHTVPNGPPQAPHTPPRPAAHAPCESHPLVRRKSAGYPRATSLRSRASCARPTPGSACGMRHAALATGESDCDMGECTRSTLGPTFGHGLGLGFGWGDGGS